MAWRKGARPVMGRDVLQALECHHIKQLRVAVMLAGKLATLLMLRGLL